LVASSDGAQTFPTRPPYTKVVLLLAIALVALLIIQGPASSLLRQWGLLARPDSYTELSFPNRAQLPVVTTAGQQVVFQFTIHNNEHRTVTYRWAATVVVGGNTAPLDQGTVRLRQGALSTVDARGVVPVLGPTVMIKVALPAQGQWIDFFAAHPEYR
jgi:hypothetical protein